MIRLPAAIAACTGAGASCGAAASPSGRIRAADPGVVGPTATQPACGAACDESIATALPAVCV